MRKIQEGAFTLLEALLVVGIIVILAGIFMPNYGKAKETALCKEAQANLKLIQAAERIFHMENNAYCHSTTVSPNPQCNTLANINTNLKLYLTNDNWDYAIIAGTAAQGFQATADRSDATGGKYKTCVYTIYGNTTGDPTASGTCP